MSWQTIVATLVVVLGGTDASGDNRAERAKVDATTASVCPASFASASVTASCDPRVAQPCPYPEGRCVCAATHPCSGVPQPPGPPRWLCRATRRDGCPDNAPAQNGACALPGRTCSYGDCGSIAYTCQSTTKTWIITGGAAPPPSTPGSVRPLVTSMPAPAGPITPTALGKPSPKAKADAKTSATRAGAPVPARTPPDWRHCAAGLHFGCQMRSQGIAPAPGEIIPEVCGCVPRCRSPRAELIAFEAEGHWPDGSRKARFMCAAGGIP